MWGSLLCEFGDVPQSRGLGGSLDWGLWGGGLAVPGLEV